MASLSTCMLALSATFLLYLDNTSVYILFVFHQAYNSSEWMRMRRRAQNTCQDWSHWPPVSQRPLLAMSAISSRRSLWVLIKLVCCGLGLWRFSHYRYTIDTEINQYVSIRSSCCTDTSGSIILHLALKTLSILSFQDLNYVELEYFVNKTMVHTTQVIILL